MKVVILAGGLGTRLSEETDKRPKPMVEIGGKPILWHIMKMYSAHGVREFVICCGYKGYMIKEFFANYFLHQSDVTIDLSDNSVHVHQNSAESWRVTLVDTGENTLTGGRLLRVASHLKGSGTFCLTYGDGLSDINLSSLIDFHKRHGKIATLTAVRPPGRFGAIKLNPNSVVESFREKPVGDGSWINGGFFVLDEEVIELIEGDGTSWESYPLSKLAASNELSAFKHDGFWQPMDTLREKVRLQALWDSGEAPWRVWD